MWVDSIMSHRVFAFPFPGGVKLWSCHVRCLPVWCVSISSEEFWQIFSVYWAHNHIPFSSVHSPGQILVSNLRNILCWVSNIKLKMNDQDFTFLLQILKEVKCLFVGSRVHFLIFLALWYGLVLVLCLLLRGTGALGEERGAVG